MKKILILCAILSAVHLYSMQEKNFYEILEVSRHATQEEIKQAYYKLSRKYHPDKGGDEETFKSILTAYEILSDPLKRKNYDTIGRTSSFTQEEKYHKQKDMNEPEINVSNKFKDLFAMYDNVPEEIERLTYWIDNNANMSQIDLLIRARDAVVSSQEQEFKMKFPSEDAKVFLSVPKEIQPLLVRYFKIRR